MAVHIEPKVGQLWADRHRDSAGRQVRVLSVSPTKVEVETVQAADSASSTRAVGRVTWVRRPLTARFVLVKDSEPS